MIDAAPTVYGITELNAYVKNKLDTDGNLSHIFVTGEISNFKAHYSGHLYMTLKDEKSSVRAVMFAGNASRLRFLPDNGMKVLVFGTVSLFVRDGSYQLYINDMQPDGVGALSVAFEQLKKKLAAEGLFSDIHKKRIPAFARRIGVVTSETGAAFHDILNVLSRRFPLAEVILRAAQVQGDGAADDIANAIRLFNKYDAADVLIVGRGGGSIEDLWAFNEEVVARAVFESHIPIISAVGHETDYTICDFVADLRAPTPSAAAELAVPDILELKSQLVSDKQRLVNSVCNTLARERERLNAIEKCGALRDPLTKLNENRRELVYLSKRLEDITLSALETEKSKLRSLAGKLDVLSPLGVISRGYALAERDGKVVSAVKDISVDDEISVRFRDGVLLTKVIGIDED